MDICGHSIVKQSAIGKPYCPNIDEYRDSDGRLDLARYAEAHPNKGAGEGETWNQFLTRSGREAKRTPPPVDGKPVGNGRVRKQSNVTNGGMKIHD